VAKHSNAEKMAGEGSRSIPTLKKWPARGRGGGEIPSNVILNLFQDLSAEKYKKRLEDIVNQGSRTDAETSSA
ncbi:MAG: hypothetical protein UHS50_09055, partial [Bacteroidaceae bacterium]|nr:hypothetical protein [Bacteroidaceae bacterium]